MMCFCVVINVRGVIPERKCKPTIRIQDLPKGEQPRERLIRFGEESLAISELLAIILKTGSHDENALQLSQRLLATFGGITGLEQVSAEALMELPGIGPAKAASLQAAFALGRRYMNAEPVNRQTISSPAVAADVLLPEMQEVQEGCFKVVLLDTRNGLLGVETILAETASSLPDLTKQVFQAAINANAAAMILAHNHQDETGLEPSIEDAVMTKEMVRAGKLLSVAVLDHLLTCRWEYVSLKERGVGFDAW